MKNVNVKKLALAGLLVAVGVVGSTFSIPVGVSRCAPVQHFINILAGVFLGPGYGVAMAFSTSLIRNLLEPDRFWLSRFHVRGFFMRLSLSAQEFSSPRVCGRTFRHFCHRRNFKLSHRSFSSGTGYRSLCIRDSLLRVQLRRNHSGRCSGNTDEENAGFRHLSGKSEKRLNLQAPKKGVSPSARREAYTLYTSPVSLFILLFCHDTLSQKRQSVNR